MYRTKGVSNRNKVRLLIKLDVPNSVFDLERTPLFEWCILECESKNGHHHVVNGDWTVCSKFVNHSRCSSKHNLGSGEDRCDHSIFQEKLHYINDLDSHMGSQYYKEGGRRHDLDLLIILDSLHTSYLTRNGCRERSVCLRL